MGRASSPRRQHPMGGERSRSSLFFPYFFFFPMEQGTSRRSSSCASCRAAAGRSNHRPPSWLAGGGGGGRFRLTSAFARGCNAAVRAYRCAEVEPGGVLKNPVHAPRCCRSVRGRCGRIGGSRVVPAESPTAHGVEGGALAARRDNKEMLILFYSNTWMP
ncbi:uncharacterized protein PRD47_002843 [Ara ararauna]